jgi:hypothetical protein
MTRLAHRAVAVLAASVGSASATEGTLQAQHLIFELDATVKLKTNTNNELSASAFGVPDHLNITSTMKAAVLGSMGVQAHNEWSLSAAVAEQHALLQDNITSSAPLVLQHTSASQITQSNPHPSSIVRTPVASIWACGERCSLRSHAPSRSSWSVFTRWRSGFKQPP